MNRNLYNTKIISLRWIFLVYLNLSKEVKQRGVVLDDKLTWKAHKGASEEGAEGSTVVQCIYHQGLETFAEDDIVAL